MVSDSFVACTALWCASYSDSVQKIESAAGPPNAAWNSDQNAARLMRRTVPLVNCGGSGAPDPRALSADRS